MLTALIYIGTILNFIILQILCCNLLLQEFTFEILILIKLSLFQSNGPSSVYEAISVQDTIRAEPEKIKVWREEQKARLEAKGDFLKMIYSILKLVQLIMITVMYCDCWCLLINIWHKQFNYIKGNITLVLMHSGIVNGYHLLCYIFKKQTWHCN